jgi:hypothetical protein
MRSLIVLILVSVMSSSCGDKNSSRNIFGELTCKICDAPVEDGNYCQNHKCEECGDLKDLEDRYCEGHKCEECGELKDFGDTYCEDHKCEQCGELKDSGDNYCVEHMEEEEEDLTCLRCGSNIIGYDKYCSHCEDELYNICSKCGGYEYGVNGGICDECNEEDYY